MSLLFSFLLTLDPNSRLLYGGPTGDHPSSSYIHRLKMLYQSVKDSSILIVAWSGLGDPAKVDQAEIAGIVCGTRTFRDFAENT